MEAENRYNEWLSGVCCMIYQRRVMTQTKLAKKTGAAREHINAVLRGRTDAGQALQDQITNALGMTYDELRALGRNNPNPAESVQVAPAGLRENGGLASVLRQFSALLHIARSDKTEDTLARASNDAAVIYDVTMTAYLMAIRSWWTETYGDGEHSAMIFMNRFRGMFPDFEKWERRHGTGDDERVPAPVKDVKA